MPPSRYLPKTTYRTKRTGKHTALDYHQSQISVYVKGGCPHYRSSTKVRYAQGFIGILENLPYKQMQTVILHLMNYLGRRTYYRARKGERLLSPSEQQHILNILRNCGVTTTQEFDAYVEDYDW